VLGKKHDGKGEEGEFVPTRIVNESPLVEMIPHDGDNNARNRRMITPRQAAEAEGRGITTIYKRLARDEYDAVKDGKSTLILWPLSTKGLFQPLQRGDLGVKMLTRLSACWAEGNLSRFGPLRSAPRKEEGGWETRRAVRLASDGPS
jgi:hypothetical protein